MSNVSAWRHYLSMDSRRLLGTVANGDDTREIRCAGGHAPASLQYSSALCGYWETRFDLFTWACDAAGFDPEESEFMDPITGEILTYWDLLDEDYETAVYHYYEKMSGDH